MLRVAELIPVHQARAARQPGSPGAEPPETERTLPDAEHVVAECVALAATHADDPQLPLLVAAYWRLVSDEDLVGRSPKSMVEATRSHRDLARQRQRGELGLTVGTSENGHTTIEIVTDDMPFLVDSVTAALTSRGLDVRLRVHPVFVVARAGLGRLETIRLDVEPEDAAPTDVVESWIRIEVDQVRDPATLQAVRADLTRVLTDVREVAEDAPKMRARALAMAGELASADLPVPDKDITDSVELLRWLVDEHFTFLGYRQYQLVTGPDGDRQLAAVLGTGLGVLRADRPHPRSLATLSPEAFAIALERRLLIITKANSRSTVHRNAYLDYIGFKTFDAEGNVTGERRFLGLFSTLAYRTSVRDLPVVRRKVAEVIERSGLSPHSHSGKDLVEILEAYPRDELFQIATDDLHRTVMGVLRLAGRRQLRVFLRRDAYGRFISCLVYLPRDRFTTANRLRISDILLRRLNGVGVDYTTRVTESHLARVHLIVRTDQANPPVRLDADALSEELSQATRLWDDDFRLVLERKLGDEQAAYLDPRYRNALPEAYKNEHTPAEAAKDVAKFELLDEPGQLAMHVYRRRADSRDVRFKVYRYGEPMILSAVLPVLHSLGVRVTDERPYEVHRTDAMVYLYDFGLQLPEDARELSEIRAHLENAFSATWRGEAEIDGFNALVLNAGLTWRQASVLRAYAKYLRQAGTPFSQEYMERTFRAYPALAALLVALFETRFDPRLRLDAERRGAEAGVLVAAIERQLDAVTSLSDDRILRGYLTLILATLRTSYFQQDAVSRWGGRPKPYLALKLDPQALPELPAPRPRYEIFVYSPRFEGVHLRFGPVARGGLRWSDRREDFRTEILGLVKAQMVKNSVIVPTGAKGGFVLKAGSGRDEAVACYQTFVSALLDVTDNLVDGAVVPPRGVVRHDGDDSYLVVAADKGTATFSDLANEISMRRGFWLGDAFASGGSTGYDHKKMGITARGTWESVKRHGRDLGLDVQRTDFTCVGVGDMSGDVFGNGALLSRHLRLVAAFDHRHIFIDPQPDAEISHGERARLFAMGRSSWDDYDRSLISEGGGVWPRTAKAVPVSVQARAALGIADPAVGALAPADLIRAILTAPVDLLFNGGIGTYVKGSGERNAEVGDKANDALRVDGADLRCRMVGEGGNLGLTQRGRVEYAMAGGRVVCDFIDNAAGVDCSDHEVNIKIMLERAVAAGQLPGDERDRLLAEMTDDVAALVLRDSYDQATALGNARAQARVLLPVHQRVVADLEHRAGLDRALEALPTDREFAARAEQGTGLTSPEAAVLLAYVKILAKRDVLASTLPDEAWTAGVLTEYFPPAVRQRFADQIAEHPLRREIVATHLVNEAVNRGGVSFLFRVVEETGATVADAIRAYVVVREAYGLGELWRSVEELDNTVDAAAQTAVYLEARRLLDRAVRWLVTTRRSPIDVPAETARLRDGVGRLLPQLETLFQGRERAALLANVADLTARGLPAPVAMATTRVMYGFGLLDIVETARASGTPVTEVAQVYYTLSERFRVDDLLSRVSALPREDRWQTLARMALRYDLYAALAGLTGQVLAATAPTGSGAAPTGSGAAGTGSGAAGTAEAGAEAGAEPSAEVRVAAWAAANAEPVARTVAAVGELDEARADLAALSVLLRQIRTLARTTG